MKKMILFIALILVAWSSLSAQTSDNYTPIVRDGSEWVYLNSWGPETYKYRIEGDSTINGINYKKLIRIGYNTIDENREIWAYVTTTHCLLREENKRVYGLPVETSPYINVLRGELFVEETGEHFLYDFNDLDEFYHQWMKEYNEKYGLGYTDGQLVFETTDSCLLVDRKCYEIRRAISHRVIEGIGGYMNRNNDLINRVWCLSGAARGFSLVLMKNGTGVYEYFDRSLYEKMLKAQHDISIDGNVDVEDLNIVINDVLCLSPQKHYYLYGSITEDNDFDVKDINSVTNYILGKIKSPLEQ